MCSYLLREEENDVEPEAPAARAGVRARGVVARIGLELRQLPAEVRHLADAGNSNQNVLPTGTPGSTPMVPPWASTASLQNARPRPME